MKINYYAFFSYIFVVCTFPFVWDWWYSVRKDVKK